MKRSQTWLVSWYLFGTCCSLATAADITLAPVTASGPHTIVGNDITLQGSGQFVTLEIQIANWDPNMVGTPLLQSYQASIDSSGYTSGLQGTLAPKLVTCPGGDIDCRTAFGGICVLDGLACVVDADCAFPSFNPCVGPACNFPPGFTDFCEPAFITDKRPDFVFSSVDNLPPALDVSVPNFRYAATVISASVADPGIPQYAGSLILDVPVGARGTFTVGFLPLPSSLLQNDSNLFILPLNLNPVRITIACQTNLDCDDGSVCTTDQCQPDGTCTNTPNFNSAIFCCNPSNGNLTTINDQNVCTDDVCDAATGTVNHSPVAVGTACGSPANTECDNPDTCNAAGMCQSNFEPSGFACGNPADTDCDNPDTCNGAGTCLPNNEPDGAAPAGLCADANDCTQDNCLAGACSNPNSPFGAACGNPSNTDCDNPDTCNGAGTCLANNEPDGTAPAGLCNDGNDCTQDNCLAAACSNPNEALGTACGSPSDTDCDNPDTCDGAGVCLSNNEPDGPAPPGLCSDGNGCTQDNCLAAACSNPNEAVGTACGDPSNTDCTNPDTCDGAGLCLANDAAVNTPCGSPADTDCDNPDTCDGTGTCLANNEPDGAAPAGLCADANDCTQDNCLAGACSNPNLPFGTACGNPGDTDCDNPDTCNGAGTCLANNEPDGTAPAGLCNDGNDCTQDNCLAAACSNPNEALGTACGSPSDTDCDNPDTCDGAGVCLSNNEPDGPAPPGLCGDGNGCTQDNCLAAACSNPNEAVGTACGDPSNTDCTNPDSCDGAGLCLANDAAANTPCGNPASTDCDKPDTCNGTGTCLPNLEPNGTLCNDNLFCTVNERCTAGTCGNGFLRDCGDAIVCTDDSCDEVNDVCVNQPNDTLCNNGQFCDGIEICDAVLDCVVMPGSVPDCNDLVGCTDDSCDEVNDVCVNQPNDTLCNNGQFCDGVEICDSVQDCIVQAGSVPNPDDGIACTDDSCDEVNDVIVNVPNDTLCPDDGLFCNGNEFCNAATGCDHTGSPCGGPCDEVGDVCLCDAPIVMAAGNRYLKIMPQPPGSGPQAIVITPDCPGSVPFVVCPPVPIDIDRDGLVDEKVAEAGFLCGPANIFLTPAEWGELYVFGKDIVPGRTYIVQGDCGSPGIPGLSDSATATTANFGDTTGVFAGGMWTPPDDDVDIFDLLAIVSAIKNEGTAPAIWQTDLIATGVNGIECLPDQATELIFDAVVAINAFQGRSYTSSTGCPAPCP